MIQVENIIKTLKGGTMDTRLNKNKKEQVHVTTFSNLGRG